LMDASARLLAVHHALGRAAAEAGRDAGDVQIVAVSKQQPATAITPLLAAGHRIFGENRVQEAMDKWPALKAAWPDVTLHAIGQLQTNKARDAVRVFDVIQTVDRPAIADALAAEMRRQDRHLPC